MKQAIFDEPLDLVGTVPPPQDGKAIQNPKCRAFGFSLQGKSHVGRGVPCQDSNDIRYLPDCSILLAAIADGVGSCSLSHWGSYIAVQASLDYLEQVITGGKGRFLEDDQQVYNSLVEAFRTARSAVEDAAEKNGQLPFYLQSTLTVAIYDGKKLWCCHAGDDGIVAQFQDGFVKMVTDRQKGEEASSVYPLQSGEQHWQVSKVVSGSHGPVVGFVMATDGVLDAFAIAEGKYLTAEGCCCGVYYPFIRDAFYDDNSRKPGPCDPNRRMEEYRKMMSGEQYRARVTDDLTLVSVISPAGIAHGAVPVFDAEAWNRVAEEIRRERMDGLYQTNSGRQAPTEGEPTAQTQQLPHVENRPEQPSRPAGKRTTGNHALAPAALRSWDRSLVIFCAACLLIAFVLGMLLGIGLGRITAKSDVPEAVTPAPVSGGSSAEAEQPTGAAEATEAAQPGQTEATQTAEAEASEPSLPETETEPAASAGDDAPDIIQEDDPQKAL